jgi:hypothetical protein
MKNVPAIIVDDFFDYPDAIRGWALSDELEYKSAEDGSWPGVRTDLTFTDFGHRFSQQVSSLLFDFSKEEYLLDCSTYFQRIKKTDHSPDSPMHQGWIHTDPTLYTGILYLNRGFPANTGTTIFEPILGGDVSDQSMKHQYYLGKDIDENEYMRQIKENNQNFVPTLSVPNKYNRLLLFEGGCYHGVESFYHDFDEDRLTVAFFVFDIKTNAKSSLERMKERY